MDYKKYKFKFRLLVIYTDNYQNEKYVYKFLKIYTASFWAYSFQQ